MGIIIVVTGTPGTGKTTVSQKIAKKIGYEYVDVNSVIKKEKLSEGYDRKRKCKIVDVKKISKTLLRISNNFDGVVIDSHLSHYMPHSKVDLCIVTKCNLKLLKKRLKRREYAESKINDNLECEAFDICLNESKEVGHNTLIIETDKKINYEKLILKIKKLLKRI